MNCRNCGGAMDLFAARGYFFCRYCGSFHFPETAGDDGIRVLGPASEPMTCAVCAKPLATALLDETYPIQYCRTCRGALIARRDFATVVQKRRAWATDTPGPPVPLDAGELQRKLACAKCRKPMATHPYYGPGNVVIDSCEACELVWLDFGELKQIVAAPGKDRGSREVVARETSDTTITRAIGGGGYGPDEGAGDIFYLLTRLF
ncbi:MAG TPA: zf-TFIIB domain-containing protein [Vicinamibacterales bacterium]|jgi:Zn-finger nucleic acid-binding protein